MTKSNSSAPQNTSNLYEHPWFTQLKLLDDTTIFGSQSQQKHKQDQTGQKSTKTCNKCNRTLPLESFGRHSSSNYLRPECRECNNKLGKIRQNLRQRYGVPDESYRCPICLRTADELQGKGGNAGVWVVDHDHNTDTFRGHLCHSCNRGVGCFHDNVSELSRAINYLQSHGSKIQNSVGAA